MPDPTDTAPGDQRSIDLAKVSAVTATALSEVGVTIGAAVGAPKGIAGAVAAGVLAAGVEFVLPIGCATIGTGDPIAGVLAVGIP